MLTKQEQLRGMMLEMFPQLKEGAQEEVTKTADDIARIKETLKAEMKSEFEAMLRAPAKKVSLTVPGEPGVTKEFYYKGIDLREQCKHSIFKLVDEEKKEAYAKMLIDVLQGKKFTTKTGMTEGTSGSGGYLVFDEYMNEILSLARLQSIALQDATVVAVNTDSFHVPLDNGDITVAWKTETTAVADGVPSNVVTEAEFNPKKLGAYATCSNELLEDSGFDIVSWLTEKFAEAIGQELDGEVFASSPDYFRSLYNTANVQDSTGTLDIAHLSDAISKLKSNQIIGAKFYFHRNIFKHIRRLKDDADNAIYSPAMGSAPATIWEYPLRLVEAGPSTLQNDYVVGYLGNLKHYMIARRKGIGSMDLDPYGQFLEYQTRLRMITRWDGKPTFPAAFVKLTY